MRWLKRGVWKLGIPLIGLLFLLVLMVWVPVSAGAYEGTSRPAIAGQVQATPTVDLTVTALAKEQLALQVQQLQNQQKDQNNWLANNSTALIAAITAIVVAFIGFTQWTGNRRDERRKEVISQDKELRAQAEERFKSAVAALGSENEATQVGGAILLRSFLNPDDEEIYGRYYAQIFDLAVAYLRFSTTSQSSEDPDVPSLFPDPSSFPRPLTPLMQALVVVFKEAFPLARNRLGQVKSPYDTRSLDASGIRLDNAFLDRSDLSHIWMVGASLRNAVLISADLSKGRLIKADLSNAIFLRTNLSGTYLTEANLSGTNFREADLRGTVLHGADLSVTNSLKKTDLRGVTGLTKEQLEVCKAMGGIVDEATMANAPQSLIPPPPPPQQSS